MFCGFFASIYNEDYSHAVNIYAAIQEQPVSVQGAERERNILCQKRLNHLPVKQGKRGSRISYTFAESAWQQLSNWRQTASVITSKIGCPPFGAAMQLKILDRKAPILKLMQSIVAPTNGIRYHTSKAAHHLERSYSALNAEGRRYP